MKNRSISILQNAIGQLPAYQAPDFIWEQVEKSLEKSDTNTFPGQASLDNHIEQLKANLQELEQTQQAILQQAIRQLPAYSADDISFDTIISGVDSQQKNKRLWYYATGIAASVLLLLAILWQFKSDTNAEQIQISYSQEILHPMAYEETAQLIDAHAEVMAFIEQHCLQAVAKCQEPQFRGLYEEFIQLQEARQELELQLQGHQQEPELMKYLIRVEKQQTEVGKKLIQQLLS